METLLVSCGKQDTFMVPKEEPEVLTTTGIISAGKKNIPITRMVSSGASMVVAQEDIIKSIKNITTLEGVSKFNPKVLQDPKKDHPWFIELQKKQMTLWSLLFQIDTPEYREIQKNIGNIYEAKELWTPEIQALDVKIQNMTTGSLVQNNMSEEFGKLTSQKNILMQELQKTQEFQSYIQKNQSKLDNLNVKMKKYWTQEIVNLEKEVAVLSKEVYSTPEKK
ncbi:MAG: hypothetical protein ACD_80C00065G0001 [uncultured bacterium (gcode 4)]|uniref:Uncharacterized protein n=1 Tax=uncultured bacterium (gcode 4) TaxID=1234023 RepID=K1XJP3_9BACT|nr:MAG: hypothetical protein ACD_80C00065G0001 [uncultured bacterium (gcode 4)]